MKSNFLKTFIVILFLSLFFLLNWNSFSAPFERDEGEYAYSAWLLRTGSTPYQDSFLQKPPMIIYTYFLGQTISPKAVWPPRVLASIFIFLTSILIGLIAFKEWGKMAGIFSAFIFLPLINFPPLTPFAANTEKFMILPMVILLALFVYFKESQKSWPYVLAGFFGVLAIFYKPICLPVVLFIIIFWLFKFYRSNIQNKFVIIKPILLICGSVFISSVIIFIPFLKVWYKVFQEIFTFNVSYLSAFGNPFENLNGYLIKFFNYWWILLILPLGFILKKPKNIFYYFILLMISLLTIFSSPIGHYYLILMPFLALLCGALFDSLLELSTNEKQRTITTVIILPIILFVIILPFKEQFSLSPQKLSEWVYGTVNPFGESREVASHLAQVTNKNDFVFVAGSEPQIYYYAERKSGTRFVITYPLNLPTPFREQFQRELISDLEKNSPKAIVFSERSMSGLWNEGSPKIFINYFNNLISKNYNIIGGYVWDSDTNGHWQEPIDNESIQNASLLLLVKK